MTEPVPQPEPTLADVLSAIAGLRSEMTSGFAASSERFDQLDAKVGGLEDRLVSRTQLLRADIAGIKAEAAVEQAYGQDAAEALRRHITDPTAHGRAA